MAVELIGELALETRVALSELVPALSQLLDVLRRGARIEILPVLEGLLAQMVLILSHGFPKDIDPAAGTDDPLILE